MYRELFIVNTLTGLPVPRLRLRSLDLAPETWAKVAALPELAQVRDLDLSGSMLPFDPRASLFERMPQLERLRLRRMPEPIALEALPSTLTWLDVGKSRLQGEPPELPSLHTLRLDGTGTASSAWRRAAPALRIMDEGGVS